MKLFDSFLEVAGNLGFLVGDNDRRRERDRKARRSWGAAVEGFALSLAANSTSPHAGETLNLEVAICNTGSEPRQVRMRNWLCFIVLEILDPAGNAAQLSLFGELQMDHAAAMPKHSQTVLPGQILDGIIPVAALYQLSRGSFYTIQASCPSVCATSNKLQIRI